MDRARLGMPAHSCEDPERVLNQAEDQGFEAGFEPGGTRELKC
jgi:hypothetical protein